MEDLSITRSLKKEDLWVLREIRSSSFPVVVVVFAVAVIVVETTHCVIPPPQLFLKLSRHLPGGRGKRRWSSSSNYFSLASKHFNATSTNELVLFSLPRNPLRHPTEEQNCVTSSPVRSDSLSELHPLLAVRTRSQLGPPLNAKSALFQLREQQ